MHRLRQRESAGREILCALRCGLDGHASRRFYAGVVIRTDASEQRGDRTTSGHTGTNARSSHADRHARSYTTACRYDVFRGRGRCSGAVRIRIDAVAGSACVTQCRARRCRDCRVGSNRRRWLLRLSNARRRGCEAINSCGRLIESDYDTRGTAEGCWFQYPVDVGSVHEHGSDGSAVEHALGQRCDARASIVSDCDTSTFDDNAKQNW